MKGLEYKAQGIQVSVIFVKMELSADICSFDS